MIRIGTSGYSYPAWRGSFYPRGLPASRMFGVYASAFPTVEINYTFSTIPSVEAVAEWARAAPPGFVYALKMPARITHMARLRNCAAPVRAFCELTRPLGRARGPLLIQLPPNFKKDLERLDQFLSVFPQRVRAAFEFRHPSWFSPDVYARLRRRNLALCIADTEKLSTPVVITSSVGYFRLRGDDYSRADLEGWARTIRDATARCRDVFVYFKHEDTGRGPRLATQLAEMLSASGSGFRGRDGSFRSGPSNQAEGVSSACVSGAAEEAAIPPS